MVKAKLREFTNNITFWLLSHFEFEIFFLSDYNYLFLVEIYSKFYLYSKKLCLNQNIKIFRIWKKNTKKKF